MGLYLCLAEIPVGKTGVPGEKTTARAEKGALFPLRSGGDPLYCDPHSFGIFNPGFLFHFMSCMLSYLVERGSWGICVCALSNSQP